jgi:hypothetical protein
MSRGKFLSLGKLRIAWARVRRRPISMNFEIEGRARLAEPFH